MGRNETLLTILLFRFLGVRALDPFPSFHFHSFPGGHLFSLPLHRYMVGVWALDPGSHLCLCQNKKEILDNCKYEVNIINLASGQADFQFTCLDGQVEILDEIMVIKMVDSVLHQTELEHLNKHRTRTS